MGLSRRFQNLILDNPYGGAKWLRSVDLTRQLFGNTAASTIGEGSESAVVQDSTSHTPAADSCNPKNKQASKNKQAFKIKMERFRLPSPIVRFHSREMPHRRCSDCFPLPDRKVVIADHTGRTFLCNVDTRRVVPMPNLHKPKSRPISLFIPSADDPSGGGGSLYVMENKIEPELADGTELSDQFEVFVCGKPTRTSDSERPWQCQLLPPPPFVRDRACWFPSPQITSYAVVGSDICISTNRSGTYNGTYCLDTVTNTWLQVAKGTPLPFFHGKVQYVPELKLWFGLSAELGHHLAAADLSPAMMDSQPQLIGDWSEFDPPEGWLESHHPQLVNLGLGRFCIARCSMLPRHRLPRSVVYSSNAKDGKLSMARFRNAPEHYQS
ncbi:hypothetical protein E2562_028964 [Oryza meyeriana var. granulata]|uniref:F-box associated domain-containing protein n=1 Tax=Oryza meyeriana var. granulata TaxID=110450 RepID=A0A6G1DQI7_9ORYZ|nr:hypothetical protein E2562_028964 [Oryza meyeriana var. granulata]